MSPQFDPLLIGALMIASTSVWFGFIFWAGMRHRDMPRRSPDQAATERADGPTVAELAEAERLACRLGVVELPGELRRSGVAGQAKAGHTH